MRKLKYLKVSIFFSITAFVTDANAADNRCEPILSVHRAALTSFTTLRGSLLSRITYPPDSGHVVEERFSARVKLPLATKCWLVNEPSVSSQDAFKCQWPEHEAGGAPVNGSKKWKGHAACLKSAFPQGRLGMIQLHIGQQRYIPLKALNTAFASLV